jgi:hypothetical protein
MVEKEDLTGRIYGRLTVLGYDHTDARWHSYWLCECSCPDHTRIIVRRCYLINGSTTSCGCVRKEKSKERATIHGCSKEPLYTTWYNMIQRCENKNHERYADYGGRNIDVCEEWHDPSCFISWAKNSGYDDDLTLDRINNDCGYSPNNCRWTDRITQGANKRNNHYVEYGGEKRTIAQWAKLFGVRYKILWQRINRGNYSDFERYFNSRWQED